MQPKAIEEINTFDGKITAVFYSITAVAEHIGVCYNKMTQLLGEGVSYKGHRYRYFGEPLVINREPKAIQQYDKTTGEIISSYDSVAAASRDLEYGRNIISRCIKEGRQDKWGYY